MEKSTAERLALAAALFERRRRAWLDEDIDAYLALWAEDMTFQSPVHAEPLRGLAAFADLVRRSAASTRPLRFDFDHLAVEDDVVLAEWTIEIERRDDGRRIAWRGMSFARLRHGLIAEWREYWNPRDLAPVLG
jgi:ketosteroid isomerase-like protein